MHHLFPRIILDHFGALRSSYQVSISSRHFKSVQMIVPHVILQMYKRMGPERENTENLLSSLTGKEH